MSGIDINNKRVFYGRRYSEPEIGSYIEYRTDKEVINPYEEYHYYLKIGGITFLPKIEVFGKKCRSSVESIRKSEFFGSYLYYGESDRKLRCVLYAKRKGLPEGKLLGQPSCLHSVIPRYSGTNNLVITGMKVISSQDSNRRWTHYDNKTRKFSKGFYYIDERIKLTENIIRLGNDHEIYRTGFYVGPNTSLLMIDMPRAHLFSDYARDLTYTLFQEGAFICTNRPFTLTFYDFEESEEFDYKRISKESPRDLGNEDDIQSLFISGEESKILFLKSAPNYTFWTLRAGRVRRANQHEMQLCVPTGGHFDKVMTFSQGIKEVKRRQDKKPWTKYIQLQSKANSSFQDIDIDDNEVYPTDTKR